MLKEVLKILGSGGTVKCIKETLPPYLVYQIEDLRQEQGNILWIEAFAIWLIGLRKAQDPGFKTPWEKETK